MAININEWIQYSQVLGLDLKRPTTFSEIHDVYINLMRDNHPDKGGDLDRAKDIAAAYGYFKQHKVDVDLIAAQFVWQEQSETQHKIAEHFDLPTDLQAHTPDELKIIGGMFEAFGF